MSKANQKTSAPSGNVFRFTLSGLIIFSLTLMSGTAFMATKLYSARPRKLAETFAVDPHDKTRSVRVGPWGDLIARDIILERPAELVAAEATTLGPETWTFKGLRLAAVKALLAKASLSAAQVAAACASGAVQENESGTVLQPSPEFILGLEADTRQQLCRGLAGLGVNAHLDFPLYFPAKIIASIYADDQLVPEDLAVLKQLVYQSGEVSTLANYQTLMEQIPTTDRRVAMARALSRQAAVFAGLSIKPGTDIEKIAAYWSNIGGVRFNDIRPMLEALSRLPEGGNLSLFYLLPQFARDRLYTFPLPPQPGDPYMDCNWTTYNFLTEAVTGRLAGSTNLVEFLNDNYYPVQTPTVCGDILLLMDDQSHILHSAVYLADDLVFTKNGGGINQPWMLMHIPDLLVSYHSTPPLRVIYMRRKTD
jgi:hypothetical protein